MDDAFWRIIALGWLIASTGFAVAFVQLAGRWMTLLEKASERPAQKPPDPMPADLLAFCNQQEMPWAREDMRKHVYELYAESGDWDRVRNTILLTGGNA